VSIRPDGRAVSESGLGELEEDFEWDMLERDGACVCGYIGMESEGYDVRNDFQYEYEHDAKVASRNDLEREDADGLRVKVRSLRLRKMTMWMTRV
jgi:hypothetical protein